MGSKPSQTPETKGSASGPGTGLGGGAATQGLARPSPALPRQREAPSKQEVGGEAEREEQHFEEKEKCDSRF